MFESQTHIVRDIFRISTGELRILTEDLEITVTEEEVGDTVFQNLLLFPNYIQTLSLTRENGRIVAVKYTKEDEDEHGSYITTVTFSRSRKAE